MNEASKAMNFTWSTDIIKDWGMFPKSGIFNFCTSSDINSVISKLFLIYQVHTIYLENGVGYLEMLSMEIITYQLIAT